MLENPCLIASSCWCWGLNAGAGQLNRVCCGGAAGTGKESLGQKILKHVPGTEARKEYKGQI